MGSGFTSAKMTAEEEYLLMIEGDRDPRPGDVIVSRNATVGRRLLFPMEHGSVWARTFLLCGQGQISNQSS